MTASVDGISASGNMTLLDGTYTMTTGGGSENGNDHQEGGPGGQGEPGDDMDNPGEDMMTSGERPKGSRGEMSDNDQMMCRLQITVGTIHHRVIQNQQITGRHRRQTISSHRDR